ncbi:GlsB/YeaQ/YmgE family stress response membrane protein [Tropicibacter alexandrii]|uniref:GlsB/YeaQ/YmgE family stress response membrane protein n=1 Tax=Tropicibacter alexandrii TaxID=2267683 RepID=UPI000EF5287F|nr:GlsB/YeaQ/YmgE family stress response membrane protein [Tropicibacter alexandrii]
MPILWLIIVGAAAGFIATRLMKMQTGLIETISIGILGALIGGLAFRFLLFLTGMAAGLVGAILGALVVIWVWKAIRG